MRNIENKNEENEIVKEEASDMEIAEFLAKHIDNPCSVETADGVKDIRGFYIKQAKEMLFKMTDENAKMFLELKIKEYE